MTWTINAAGHVDTEADERRLIEDLAGVFGAHPGGAVTIATQFHGAVDLTRPTAETLPTTTEPDVDVEGSEPAESTETTQVVEVETAA